MKPDLRFEFTVDKAQGMLTVTREYDGTHQLVWDCHTKQELPTKQELHAGSRRRV